MYCCHSDERMETVDTVDIIALHEKCLILCNKGKIWLMKVSVHVSCLLSLIEV